MNVIYAALLANASHIHVVNLNDYVSDFALECVSSGTIRKFEQILCQFKEETRRLISAKSRLVTQKWRSDARNCVLRNF